MHFELYYLVGADIIVKVTDKLVNETNTVTFRCQAIGEPVPTISWYFNGVMVNVSDIKLYSNISLLNRTLVEGLLIITNVQSSDVGTYTCHAENIIGIDRSSGILTVNGKNICSPYECFKPGVHLPQANTLLVS